MARAERDLLRLREILVDSPIQNHLANLDEGHLFFRPYLRRVQNVKVKLILILLRDDLNGKRPLWRGTILYCLVEILPMKVYGR